MKSLPQYKSLMMLIAGTALIGLVGNFFLLQRKNDAVTQHNELKKQIRDESKLQSELMVVKSKLQESSLKLDHLDQRVAASAYIPTLLKELERIGRENGLEVTGIKPHAPEKTSSDSGSGDKKDKKPEKPKGYDELMIEVKGTGTYNAIHKFVRSLEEFPKIVGVNGVDLTPHSHTAKKDDDPNLPTLLDMTIELRAYVFPDPSQMKTEATMQTENTSSAATQG